MTRQQLVILAQRTVGFGDARVDLFAGFKRPDGTVDAACPLVFKNNPEGDVAGPFLTLTATEAQVLIDRLWDCGLRPSEGSGSAGALAATQRHLEDMRTLVLHPLGLRPRAGEPA